MIAVKDVDLVDPAARHEEALPRLQPGDAEAPDVLHVGRELVVHLLEVDEGADLAVLVARQLEVVPGGEVGGAVEEQELPAALDLAIDGKRSLQWP